MPRVVLAHPPQTREALWWTVRALFGITIPRTRVCPDHCSPFDAFADAFFGECSIRDGQPIDPEPISQAIWHASRGLAGKSKTLSVLGLLGAYVKGADITILGGSMAQSTNVHDYMVTGMEYENLPQDMTLDQTATKILLTNRARIRPLPASQKHARGPHPSWLLMDEVDEMEIGIYDAALGQPMPQPNYLEQIVDTMTVISSTWQNPEGTLTEIFQRNEDRGNKIPIYRWCYKENHVDNNPPGEGWLTERTIQEKRDSVSVEMFRTEYDLGEPSIGNRAFDPEKVEGAFCRKFRPEDEVGEGDGYIDFEEKKDFWMYRFERYKKGCTYVAGADWAKEQDYTVIRVSRVFKDTQGGEKRRLVFYLRVNRRPYPVMIGYFNKVLREYKIENNGSFHDSTGVGVAVNDYVDVRARAFTMTGDKRAKLLSTYVNAIEKGAWELPRIPKLYTEHKYCSVGDLYLSDSKHHLPDTVAAGALEEHAVKRVATPGAPVVVKRDGTPTKLEQQFSPRETPQRESESAPVKSGAMSFVVH